MVCDEVFKVRGSKCVCEQREWIVMMVIQRRCRSLYAFLGLSLVSTFSVDFAFSTLNRPYQPASATSPECMRCEIPASTGQIRDLPSLSRKCQS